MNDPQSSRHLESVERQEDDARGPATSRDTAVLERLGNKLITVNRLANVAGLAGHIAHEINNVGMILASAIMGVEDAVRDGQPTEEGVVRELHQAFDLITQHTRRLGDLSRVPSSHTEQLDLRQIVSGTLDLLRATGRTKYVKVAVSLPEEPIQFRINRSALEQLMIDLVCNATDASDSLGESQVPRTIGVVLERRGGRIALSVADDGPGVAPEVAAQLFEPFVSSKAPGRGTGLGLPAARQIALALGGTLQLEPGHDHGACFVLELPDPSCAKAA